jgi:hypothetical protein
VIEVDTSTAQLTSTSARRPALRSTSQRRHDAGPTTESVGSVIMYNPDKGFGFVESETELAIDLRTAIDVAIRDLREIQAHWGQRSGAKTLAGMPGDAAKCPCGFMRALVDLALDLSDFAKPDSSVSQGVRKALCLASGWMVRRSSTRFVSHE